MKTKLSLCGVACLLAACSNSPSGSELASSMTSELQKACEYASVDNAQITNTFFPNSDNKNIANVKFTATVKVKIEGKLAQEDERGYLIGDRQKHSAEMRELYSQKEALGKEWLSASNGVFDKYTDRAANLLYATSSGKVRTYAQPSKPEISLACFGYRDPRKPLGILYRAVMDGKGSSDDYYAGVETSIEGERQMIKTDNGWMVAGNL